MTSVPQVLLLDGRNAVNFLELHQLASENDVHLVESPAHTAHWLQPCERGLLEPLIDTYRSIPQLTSKSDQWWNEQDFVAAFTEAWARTVSQERIAAAFKACGVFPVDALAIPASQYQLHSGHLTEEILSNPSVVENNA